MKETKTKTKLFVRTIIVMICIGICVSVCGVTYAYLLVGDKATNTLYTGETVGEIVEEYPTDVVPASGKTVKKEVKVTNTGNLPSFVRLRIVYSDNYHKNKVSLVRENEELWVYDEATDFYYYKNLILPGETTELFMTGVAVPQMASGTEFEITVYTELTHHIDHQESCSQNEFREIWS
jgi:hypothetical protein